MKVPPLSKRPNKEDEEYPHDEQTSSQHAARDGFGGDRDDAHRRPTDVRARAQSWMHTDAVGWGIRVAIVGLFVGGFYAVYINGVAEGWWRAWGDTPTVAATTTPTTPPSPTPSTSSEPAMSGGYEIGPDGVLIRPAEHAASTYTKPDLPKEAKENTQRGAELTAEYLLATLTYAWNTGDTQPFSDITEPGEAFRETYIDRINNLYVHGWMYDNKARVTNIVAVDPITDPNAGAQPNTTLVLFDVSTSNGTSCIGQRIIVSDSDFNISLGLFMTWKDGRWIATGGDVSRDDQE